MLSRAATIVEARSYSLLPSGASSYIACATEASSLRKSLSPLVFFGTPETGGLLNEATHLYAYESLEARAETRAKSAKNEEWKKFLTDSRPFVGVASRGVYCIVRLAMYWLM